MAAYAGVHAEGKPASEDDASQPPDALLVDASAQIELLAPRLGDQTRAAVKKALALAAKDVTDLAQLLEALEATPQDVIKRGAAAGSTAKARLEQRLEQKRLSADVGEVKQQLRSLLEEHRNISSLFLSGWGVGAENDEMSEADLTAVLSNLVNWQATVLANPLVARWREYAPKKMPRVEAQPR